MSLPGRVTSVAGDGSVAVVEGRGRATAVSLAVLTLQGVDVAPGDWLLTAAGLAVARITEGEARDLLELVDRGGEP